jgi:hypothetical protein
VSAAAIHRQAIALAERLGKAAPTYRIVYADINDLAPVLVTLAHEGTRVYAEASDLIHRHEATGPNAVWQADHTELDIWLKDGRGQPEKPWLTIILNDYSRAVARYSRMRELVRLAIRTEAEPLVTAAQRKLAKERDDLLDKDDWLKGKPASLKRAEAAASRASWTAPSGTEKPVIRPTCCSSTRWTGFGCLAWSNCAPSSGAANLPGAIRGNWSR